jgi:two-component system, LuxR family, sensor kinase FixL
MNVVRATQTHDSRIGGHPVASLPLATGLIVFTPVVLLGNLLGSFLRYPDIGAAVLYPPYAILTAALVVCPARDRVWYILVGSGAHLFAHWPEWSLSWVLFADVANIARALVAAMLLRRLFGGVPCIDSIRVLSQFMVTAVLAAPAVGATIGAANVMFHGASNTFLAPWIAWLVSNALTGLVTLPACLCAFEYIAGARRIRIERAAVLETLLLGGALVAMCGVAFVGTYGRPHLAVRLYAPLPILIWAAVRFGSGGASLALTMVTVAAIWSVDRGASPFLASGDGNLFALQIFVLLTSIPVLCLAAVATARQRVVQLYRALLASLQDHVAILDAHGVVLEVNDSWRRFAQSASTVPGFHRVRPGDPFLTACRVDAEHGDATAEGLLAGVTSVLNRAHRRFEMEYDLEHDGRREVFTVTAEALERSDGGVVVTRSNVTARREAQVQNEEQRRELSHLARVSVLGQLSGAFAHELNQPLAAILSNAETARHLLRRQPVDVEQLSAIMQDIVADDQRAAAVIRRLRALLKRGDKRLHLVEARELLDDVLKLAQTELLTRHISAAVVVEPGLPLFLGDKVQLQQVLLNLLLNACEAMSLTPAPDRRLVLTAAGSEATGHVHFSVRDCGTGIAPDLIGRVFEPFVTTKSDGLGLGLSISQTIVGAHGGRLWAENNPDGGVTMHCLLPTTERSRIDASPATEPVLTAGRET